MNTIDSLTPKRFVEDIIAAYRPQKGPLPLIIGAGVSASSGIPTNDRLLQEIARNIYTESCTSYDELYKYLKHMAGGKLKAELRDCLKDAGIRRRDQKPSPNVSNFAILHLLQYDVFGPVISLNVDPLLAIASEYEYSQADGGLHFICNDSQLSEPGLDYTKSVLQVHGSIEEPLSLRFVGNELAPRNGTIMSAVTDSISRATTIVCIGSSLADDVIPKLLAAWVNNRIASTEPLRFYVAFYRDAPKPTLEKIQKQMNRVLRQHDTTFHLCFAENVDADTFFADMIEQCHGKTLEYRGRGSTSYYVPLMTRNLLRATFHKFIAADTNAAGASRVDLPKIQDRLLIELMLHAVQSRGPFTLADLSRNSRMFRSLSLGADDVAQPLLLNKAIARLVNFGVLSFAQKVDNDWRASNPEPAADSFGAIQRVRLIRHARAASAEDFAERCFNALEIRTTGDAGEDRAFGIVKSILDLERDREEKFAYEEAIPVIAYFDNPTLLRKHRQLDAQLDELKLEIKTRIDRKQPFECFVVTESGEHLFKRDKLEGATDIETLTEKDPGKVAEYMRDWIGAAYLRGAADQTIDIFLSRTPKLWLFPDHSATSRKAFEAKVEHLMGIISSPQGVPNIRVYYADLENHNDHMWYFKSGPPDKWQGVYYPTYFDERPYYAIKIEGAANIEKLDRIRRKMFANAGSCDQSPTSYVLALTMIDETRSDLKGRNILVCIRNPEANGDHKGVASVPTKRLPKVLFDEIVGHVEWQSMLADTKVCSQTYLADRHAFILSQGKTGTDSLRDAINDLLSRKFNLGDAIERGELSYQAKPIVLRTGRSPRIGEGDSEELIAMVNVAVFLQRGASLFTESASYSRVAWMDGKAFRLALDDEEPVDFGRGEQYKYGGLCVCTTHVLLALDLKAVGAR